MLKTQINKSAIGWVGGGVVVRRGGAAMTALLWTAAALWALALGLAVAQFAGVAG